MQQSRAEGAEVSSGRAGLEGSGGLGMPSWGSGEMQKLGLWEYR